MNRVSVLLVLFSPLLAQTLDETPTLTIPRVDRAPKLTDFLNGVAREAELKVTDFRQMDPGDGSPVSQSTEAYLSYDAEKLYVVFVAKDDPRLIRARVAKRKQILSDDRVTINIDTFHDHRHAYWFDVNPYAIQLDGITTDGYGDDFSWEGLWHTEAKITADGYVVFIAVPFKTLRFPNNEEQTWGVMLGRFIQRNNEFSMWPYITRRKLPRFVEQFGHLKGLKNISPGRNIQFIPYGLGSTSRFLDQRPVPPRISNETDVRAGIDAKVVLKDALTLDVTVNPDFSQVESDEPQVTVNQRYEVFFPEKRPFFMENASYFNTPENLFFSRRIVDPTYGVRLTGKIGRWGIGVLGADDRAVGDDGRAFAGALSIQRDFLKDSHVRLFSTERNWGTSFNRLASLDGRLRLKHDFFFTGQAITSHSRLPHGEQLSGNDYFAKLNRTTRKVQYFTQYTDRSPGFRADLGFITRTDVRELKNRLGYKWWLEKKTLVNFGPAIVVSGNRNRAGKVQDWEANLEWSMEFTRLTSFTVSHGQIFELYRNIGFRKHATNYVFTSEWLKWLAFNATYSHGSGVNYYPSAKAAPFLGDGQDGNLGLTIRPTSKLRIDQTYIYSHLRTRSNASSTVYTNHIARTKVNYQLSRELSFRAIVDYNGVIPNSSLVSLDPTRRVGYDLLMTYLLHPGTAFHIGYTDLYQNLLLDPARPPYLRITGFPDMNTGRQVFVKLSYLFRF